MSEVLPGLFLGDAADSATLGRDADLVVNCTADLPFHGGARQLRLPVHDNGDERQQDALLALLPYAVREIEGALCAGGRVLVHCRAGHQRSAAVVAAYLMAATAGRVASGAAVEAVRAKRPVAFFGGVNFARTLAGFEEQLRGAQQ